MSENTSQPARAESSDPAIEQLVKSLEREAAKVLGDRGNTFVDSKTLCTSCQHAVVTRRTSQNHRQIYCSWFSKVVPEDIGECSKHFRINELSLFQMAQLAHFIEVRDTNQGYL